MREESPDPFELLPALLVRVLVGSIIILAFLTLAFVIWDMLP